MNDLPPSTAPQPPEAEYIAIRGEATTWIMVEYTLLAATATVTAISFGFIKQSDRWPFYSASLLLITACFGLLTSFARAKIRLASAYLAIFHRQRTYWERLIAGIEVGVSRIATKGHSLPLFAFYLVLFIVIVCYPCTLHPEWQKQVSWENIRILLFPALVYVAHLVVFFNSYRVQGYHDLWQRYYDEIAAGKCLEQPNGQFPLHRPGR